ncbi:hypothetical protein A9J32_07880 [Staphylococcus epidermidis]|uniref:hypothetical protein n=1 Tax=Staphylococcus epidermidis TaxID=1282 RepID=UPI00066DDF50|nr:hypothetical protein [Staphylococcus epidermidis]MBM6005591.1 hypothetical protein [Staphylococcus epidermidis]MBM6085578.1 hypothetical protein [Staphylococcus epidermidis]MBM6088078.1 hypothetical protein [Staphylococcus epidermidis]MBM6090548.1 hypothetical protein [Staphylococcus epidermidis]MBM6093075.1 hypothetical protein [Staphylococcus epidermidis]
MVKIKRKVEMTLPELIEWAWKNDVNSRRFKSSKNTVVTFSDYGGFVTSIKYVFKDETFTVEIEEEITEDTQIYRLLELKDSFIFKDGGWKDLDIIKSNMYGNRSISEVKNDESKKFYMLNDDDTMTLIWKDGELVGDE